MKKLLLLLVILVCALQIKAQIRSQTVEISTTTNGIAPIPAFKLGEPAGLIFFNTSVGKHFIIAPDITFSLNDGKLWFSDVWVKYYWKLDSASRWTAILGADFPSFIGQATIDNHGQKITKAENYPTGEIAIKYMLKNWDNITLDYWYLQALNMKTGIKGSYLSLSYNFSKNIWGDNFSIDCSPNIFYLNYSDGTNGFACSIKTSISHSKTGLFISTQEMAPLTVNNTTACWNISAGIKVTIF